MDNHGTRKARSALRPHKNDHVVFFYGALAGTKSSQGDVSGCQSRSAIKLLASLLGASEDALESFVQHPEQWHDSCVLALSQDHSRAHLGDLVKQQLVTVTPALGSGMGLLRFPSSSVYQQFSLLSAQRAAALAWWVEHCAGAKRKHVDGVKRGEERLIGVAVGRLEQGCGEYRRPGGLFAEIWRLKSGVGLSIPMLHDGARRFHTAMKEACKVYRQPVHPVVMLFLDKGVALKGDLDKYKWHAETVALLARSFPTAFDANGVALCPLMVFVAGDYWMYNFGICLVQEGLSAAFPGSFGPPKWAVRPSLADEAEGAGAKYRPLIKWLETLAQPGEQTTVTKSEEEFVRRAPPGQHELASQFYRRELVKWHEDDVLSLSDEVSSHILPQPMNGVLDLEDCVHPAGSSHNPWNLPTLDQVMQNLTAEQRSSVVELRLPGTSFTDSNVGEIRTLLDGLPNIKHVDLSGQFLGGSESEAFFVDFLEDQRRRHCTILRSSGFMNLAWKTLISRLSPDALGRLVWLPKAWLSGPAAERKFENLSQDKVLAIRSAHDIK